MGNDKKPLSAAEQKRLDRFEKTSEELEQQGYTRHDLTIRMGKANGFTLCLMLLLFVVGYGLFYLVHHRLDFTQVHYVIIVILALLLTVLHELIHGFCFSLFTPHRIGDIEFGIMKPSLTPYCTCLVPLKKEHYLFGILMPFILLGVLPMAAGILLGQPDVLFLGIIMAAGAGGDLLIAWRILRYQSQAKEIIFMDHPTEAGCVVFER